MNTRKKRGERIRRELEEWGRRIDHLKVQANLGKKEARDKASEVIADLRKRWRDLSGEISELPSSGSRAWHRFKDAVRTASARIRGDAYVPIERLMTSEVAAVRESESLAEAARIMWGRDCGIVPVLDSDGRLSGVITDRDVCMGALTQGRPISEVAVHQSMSHDVVSCSKGDDVAIVHDIMRRHCVRRLPVVDDEERIAGIVSLDDIARHTSGAPDAARAEVAETLAAVTQSRPIPHTRTENESSAEA